jgi:hypothetical protein
MFWKKEKVVLYDNDGDQTVVRKQPPLDDRGGEWAWRYPHSKQGRCFLQDNGTVLSGAAPWVSKWKPYPVPVLELNRKAKWRSLLNTLPARVVGAGTTWRDIAMGALGVLAVICLLGMTILGIYMGMRTILN